MSAVQALSMNVLRSESLNALLIENHGAAPNWFASGYKFADEKVH